jgi:hypothetical protein
MWQNITSPDYPQVYCESMSCKWRLTISDRQHTRTLLRIADLNTEAQYDSLILYDGELDEETVVPPRNKYFIENVVHTIVLLLDIRVPYRLP